MMRSFLRSRIHGAIVTEADAHNEESIAIDPHLIAAADLMSYEKVEIYNLAKGNRFQTFVIESRPGEGKISLNGSAARLGKPGDELTSPRSASCTRVRRSITSPG